MKKNGFNPMSYRRLAIFVVLFAFFTGYSPMFVAAQSDTGGENENIQTTSESLKTINDDFIKATSIEDYERFIENHKPQELAFVAVQRLAKPYLKIHDWKGAIAIFDKYKSYFPAMSTRFNKIISALEASEEGLAVRNMGPQINTIHSEYHPIISADGKKLYFARDQGAAGGEDVFLSRWDGENWSEAVRMEKPISTRRHEVPLSVSADNNTLVLFGNYPGSLGRGDIFYCEKGGACWNEVQHYPPPINSEYFETDAMLPADGKTILFVSERPGGIGGFHKREEFYHGSYNGNTDIYVYVKTSSGSYEMINLGSTINTPYSEHSPYLHPDGKTLYFSSDGHYGLGGLDVFKSTRLSDTSWTEWSEPENLGKEINSPDNDWGYQVSTTGELAYFSTAARTDGLGRSDIFSIGMPEKAKPSAVTTISGKVTDPAGNPLSAGLKWNDLTVNREAGEASSDPYSGEYFIVLPAEHMYSYYAVKEGYIGESQNVDLRDKEGYKEYTVDIVLYPLERLVEKAPPETTEAVTVEEAPDTEQAEKPSLRVNNIFFDFNKSELREPSFLELDRWVTLFREYPGLTAEIHGHADSTGPEEYNQKLSERRAQAVVNYLIQNDIDGQRLVAKGFGEEKPAVSNETVEGRSQNRRVEIVFDGTLEQ